MQGTTVKQSGVLNNRNAAAAFQQLGVAKAGGNDDFFQLIIRDLLRTDNHGCQSERN